MNTLIFKVATPENAEWDHEIREDNTFRPEVDAKFS
jgi:hypothetical protein